MAQLLGWEQYSSLHTLVSETEFTRFEALAEIEVKRVIGSPRFADITSDTFGYDTLLDCIANVIDKLKTDETSGKGKGITSASNDGYSETYADTKTEDVQRETATAIRNWLSGTGLVRAY